MRDILLYILVAVVFGALGSLVAQLYIEGQWDRRMAYMQALCPDGLVSYHQGDYFCFTERAGVKQWRPRWDRAYIVSEH